MLQLKSLQDARRTRANLSGCPSRLHSANSLVAGRASPTSGNLRTGFVGPAGGSGRALAGGRAHRGLGGAHWLNKQAAPVGLNCRAVAVETRSSPDAPRTTPQVSTESPELAETAPKLPTSETSATLSGVDVSLVDVHTEQVAASAASSRTRPRMPSRTESEGFELVAADVPLVEAPPDLDDWEIVSSDDLAASALA